MPTLKNLISGNNNLWVFCNNVYCLHRVERTPETLVAAFGEDKKIAEIKRRSKCSKCGSKNVSVSFVYQGLIEPRAQKEDGESK